MLITNKLQCLFLAYRIQIIIIAMIACIPVSAGDVIIDKQGNEVQGSIVRVEKGTVLYRPDSLNLDSVLSIPESNVFMIKYADGRKQVYQITKERASQDPLVSARRISVAIEGQLGTFGLFNVDTKFTQSDITFGATPCLDLRLTRFFSAGGECMVLFGKPKTNDEFRLIINLNIRGTASFVINRQITMEVLVAGGMSVWPKAEGAAFLDSTFLDARTGWNARASLCGEYIINPRWSILLTAGYSANSTESRNVWITHDMMLVGIGPKIRF